MTVVSERAEEAQVRVNRALAHFRDQVEGDETRPGAADFGRTTSGAWATGKNFHLHDAVLRLVAIAEDFSIGRLVEVVEATLPPDPIVSELWETVLDRSGDGWDQRDKLWKRYQHVDVAAFPQRQALVGFIDARNAIAHGLGGLTRRQLRKRDRTIGRLEKANIQLVGDLIVIDASHVEACASVVKAFIDWLDRSS